MKPYICINIMGLILLHLHPRRIIFLSEVSSIPKFSVEPEMSSKSHFAFIQLQVFVARKPPPVFSTLATDKVQLQETHNLDFVKIQKVCHRIY